MSLNRLSPRSPAGPLGVAAAQQDRPGRPPFVSEEHPSPVNGMVRATSTKCGWHSSHMREGAWALRASSVCCP